MSAIFSFPSLITVLILLICTCTYIRDLRPNIFDSGMVEVPGQRVMKRPGFSGFCWKLSRIGERLSPFVSGFCLIMAVHVLIS